MKYRFTRAWARVLIVAGFAVIAAGVLVSIAALVVPATEMEQRLSATEAIAARIVGAALAVVLGLLVGGPVIVAGQLLLILLDQRALLARQARLTRAIYRRVDRWERSGRGEPATPPVADRLLRRK